MNVNGTVRPFSKRQIRILHGLSENGEHNRSSSTPSQAPVLLNLYEKALGWRLLSHNVN